jgi:hypothetical protein
MAEKLIGTEPHQVPSNADLGSMAFVDHSSIGDIRVRSILNFNASNSQHITAGDEGVITLKSLDNGRNQGLYLERYNERRGYYIYPSSGGLGGSDTLNFDRNNAGTKATTMALDRDGNAHFGNDVYAAGTFVSTDEATATFSITDTFTATAGSVSKFAIDLTSRLGFGTAGTINYIVTIGGYGSGGTNGVTAAYKVGGYAGHSWSAFNHNSFGAGTINNGYKSSNTTSYNDKGLVYHPCENLGAFIHNGQVYAYSPGPQRLGFAVSNANSTYGMGCIVTITGTYS